MGRLFKVSNSLFNDPNSKIALLEVILVECDSSS